MAHKIFYKQCFGWIKNSLSTEVSYYGNLMLYYFVTFVIVIIFCVAFCDMYSAAADNENIPEYRIGSGDVIQISVYQNEQFNSTVPVGPDGKITLPFLGDIIAAGFTRKELKDDITNRLSKFIKESIEVTVGIMQFNSQKISIFGRVANPKIVTFSIIPTLLEVIIQAVPAPDADLTTVKIIPVDPSIRKPIVVNIADVLQSGDTSHLPKLHSGDTIYIPKVEVADKEKTTSTTQSETVNPAASIQQSSNVETKEVRFVINVMGAVVRPGSIVSSEELSLTQALIQAGSVTDNIALKDIRVLRAEPTNGERVIHVDLNKYLTEGDSSILPKLYSGDTIYVPPTTQDKMKEVSIIITGEVVRPGSYETLEPVDILDAISMAGGLTSNADPERIIIRREDTDSYQDKVVNIEEFIRNVRSNSPLEMVEPGYRIYVPAKERSLVITTASATRGIVIFLADLVPIYGLYRLIK